MVPFRIKKFVAKSRLSLPGLQIEPGDEAHFLIGPDGLVWHTSWSPRPELEKKREAYTRAYELGRAGVLEENVAVGKRFLKG